MMGVKAPSMVCKHILGKGRNLSKHNVVLQTMNVFQDLDSIGYKKQQNPAMFLKWVLSVCA